MKASTEEPALARPRTPLDEEPSPTRKERRGPPSGNWVLWVLGGLLLVVATLNLSQVLSISAKTILLEIVAIVLAVYVASTGEWTGNRVRAALLAAPNLAILGFLVWIGFSVARTDISEIFKKLSYWEAFRHLGGALLYFVVVYGLSVRRHLRSLVTFVVLAGGLGALVALVIYTSGHSYRLEGALPNNENYNCFLTLMAPTVVMAAMADDIGWRRISAQISAVVILASLPVGLSRSSWIGSALGLLALGLLYLAFGRRGTRVEFQKQYLVAPLVGLALAAGLFFFVSRDARLQDRYQTTLKQMKAGNELSLKYRWAQASKAVRIMQDHPVLGSGIGTYRITQALYYAPNGNMRSQKQILRDPQDYDNCHNSYLHVGAELGVPGLFLYLGIFLAFFGTAFPALRRLRPGFRQRMLMGAMASIAGSMVTVLANSGWEFAEVSLFVWLILGMGMAIAGVGERGQEPSGEEPARRKRAG